MLKGKYLLVAKDWMEEYVARIASLPENFDIKTIEIFGQEIEVIDVLESVTADTATINIIGPMSMDGPDLIDLFFGEKGVAYSEIQSAFKTADSKLSETIGDTGGTILTNINTPGGEVSGVDETRSVIADVASRREVVFVNRGHMTSGGEFLASAATKVVSSGEVAVFGSIGVVVSMFDFSKLMDRIGIKQHVITNTDAGSKRADPGTEEGREIIKVTLDEIAEVFFDRMESTGKISRETLKKLDGGIVLSRRAVELGLADEIINGGSVTVSAAATDEQINKLPAVSAGSTEEIDAMTLQEAIAQNPAMQKEVDALVQSGFEAGAAKEKEAIEARVKVAKPFLGNSKYPKVSDLAIQVMVGEEAESTLKACVTVLDMGAEAEASTAAQAETAAIEANGGTPPNDPTGEKGSEKIEAENNVLRGAFGCGKVGE